MSLDIYKKGVKTSEIEYSGTENSWVTQESGPSGGVKKTNLYRLSIEPATLRYTETLTVTLTAGSGDAAATRSYTVDSELGSGTCEKIPYKQSN